MLICDVLEKQEGATGGSCHPRPDWLAGSRLFICYLCSHWVTGPKASPFLILPLPTGAPLYRQAGNPITVQKLAWGLCSRAGDGAHKGRGPSSLDTFYFRCQQHGYVGLIHHFGTPRKRILAEHLAHCPCISEKQPQRAASAEAALTLSPAPGAEARVFPIQALSYSHDGSSGPALCSTLFPVAILASHSSGPVQPTRQKWGKTPLNSPLTSHCLPILPRGWDQPLTPEGAHITGQLSCGLI